MRNDLDEMSQRNRGGGGEDHSHGTGVAAGERKENSAKERGTGEKEGSFHLNIFTSISREEEKWVVEGWSSLLLLLEPEYSRLQA